MRSRDNRRRDFVLARPGDDSAGIVASGHSLGMGSRSRQSKGYAHDRERQRHSHRMPPLLEAGSLDVGSSDGKAGPAGTIHTWPERNSLQLLDVDGPFDA